VIDAKSAPTRVIALTALSTVTARIADSEKSSVAYGWRAVAKAEHLALHPSTWSISASVFVTLESTSHSLNIGGDKLIGQVVRQTVLVSVQLWRQTVGAVAVHLVSDGVEVFLQEALGDLVVTSRFANGDDRQRGGLLGHLQRGLFGQSLVPVHSMHVGGTRQLLGLLTSTTSLDASPFRQLRAVFVEGARKLASLSRGEAEGGLLLAGLRLLRHQDGDEDEEDTQLEHSLPHVRHV